MGAIADRISELENAIENEVMLQDFYHGHLLELGMKSSELLDKMHGMLDEIDEMHFWQWSKKRDTQEDIDSLNCENDSVLEELEEYENKMEESKSRLHTFQNELGQTVALLEEVGEDPDENGEIPLDDEMSARLDALFADED